MKKIVLKLDISDRNAQRQALKAISTFQGIDAITYRGLAGREDHGHRHRQPRRRHGKAAEVVSNRSVRLRRARRTRQGAGEWQQEGQKCDSVLVYSRIL